MDSGNKADIPYIMVEGELARAERHIKRLWIALIAVIVALVICNVAYLWYLNQYDFESYTLSTEGGGNANFIGNDGDIYENGTSESDTASKEEE